jgi:hypothetical protein
MSEREVEVSRDVKVISAIFTRLEFLLATLYVIFGGFFVWYIIENFTNYYGAEETLWGLPKPVAGALILAIEWIAVNLLVFAIYYIVVKRKLRGG